jgi:hypothetical protein
MTGIRRAHTREEVAAWVCEALDRAGIPVVLSGEAVVSIYSDNAYESFDLDFIRQGVARKVDGVMGELGFRSQGRHWTHPDSPFWVEFPPGPVQVGGAIVREFAERQTRVGTLRLLAPTECVMDRLAGYYHWDDPQCLDQAIEVARRHTIDLERIDSWSRDERSSGKFGRFRERLREEDPTPSS